MLDAWMRRRIDTPLDRLGRSLAAAGLRANQVTLLGFIAGVAAVPLLAVEAYWPALVLILLNRLADGLDGAIARNTQTTDLGGYLDIVCDFLVYSGLVFGFALARPEANALPAAFLILSFVGTGSSFLAYAVVATKRGVTTKIRGHKSFYYLGGLTEGTETFALFVLLCLFPDAFPWLAWMFGGLCWITTAFRILAAVRAFGEQLDGSLS